MIRRARPEGRRLATVLFTDMVGSTEWAIELGDRAWRVLLRKHQRAVRAELRRFGGHEVDSAGDGFFATFPQPADAVRCALAIRAVVRPLGLAVRSAVHTGEVEPIGQKVGGVAVHLAARALSTAEPDEILVTSTVRDLVAGSELKFADAGTHTFKGFAEPWHVFRVTGPEPSPKAAEAKAAEAKEDDERPLVKRGTAIALGGVIGAVLVVGALVLLGVVGQPTGLAPGPNTVVRLTSANEVERTVAVARGPSAMVVADGALWVASAAGTVTRVDLDDLAVQVVGGVGIPTALASADGSIWVAEAYAGRVSRIDAATVQVRDSVDVHARRILATSDALWMTDDLGDRVTRLSTATLDEDGAVALEAASGPRAIAAGGNGSIWVGNERSATLVKIDAASAASIGHPIGLGSPATELAVGNGSVWVTSMDADRLYRIDLEQGQVVATIETCDGPDAVVATDEGVWIACRVGQVVRRLATDGSFVADIEVPGVPAALATDGVGVWVALRGD
jgi:class 3 adenylate cyclase/streptogramin lyase